MEWPRLAVRNPWKSRDKSAIFFPDTNEGLESAIKYCKDNNCLDLFLLTSDNAKPKLLITFDK
jgi:hypothetical protein